MIARKSLGAGLMAVALMLFTTSLASAAPVDYALQFAPKALPQYAHLVLDGDQLTTFWVELRPTSCETPMLSDNYYIFSLPAQVPVNNGQFSFQARADSEYPGGSYGADISAQGTVSPDHRVISGTLTLSNGRDPFYSGCSGTFNFYALPRASKPEFFALNPKADFVDRFMSFDYSAGVVRHLRLRADFRCGTSVNDVPFYGDLSGFRAIHTSASGRFSVHTYALDAYMGVVVLDITGRIGRKSAAGRYSVSEAAGGFSSVGTGPCAGHGNWWAEHPAAPPKPSPEVYFSWNAARVPVAGAYRYYFYVTGLRCSHGATAASIGVGSRRFRFGCHRHRGFASGPLAPGAAYVGHAQALRIKNHRVKRRGDEIVEPLTMPSAGDRWVPTGGLGNPPG